MTIPQYNFRLGYYLNDHWNVSLGIDHMKRMSWFKDRWVTNERLDWR